MSYLSNINYNTLTDKAILEKIGQFVKHQRLKLNKSQAQLALDAGINRSTLIELEAGKGGNLMTFIQITRALKQLNSLSFLELETEISPLLLAEMQSKYERKRASKSSIKNPKKTTDW